MSLFITSLNSGSNGNCYYVGNSTQAILLDVGISCREVLKRMERLGLNIGNVKGIFISHEHTDHIKGVAALAKKCCIPVFLTKATYRSCSHLLENVQFLSFNCSETILLGNLSIKAFSKKHDACDPCSFVVEHCGVFVGVFTDIGIACTQVVEHFKKCHAVFLESNYDEEMLRTGSYPYHLKRRITNGHGHLSNKQAFDLVTTHKPAHLRHLILSHLSHNNNCPKLVQQLFAPFAPYINVVVASRLHETEVYQITNENIATTAVKKRVAAPQLAFAFG